MCHARAIAGEVGIAVASNFAAPAKLIATAFERQTGHKALLSFGATGQLFAQIKNGAPFDVFLSADSQTAIQLERSGWAAPGTRFSYAMGRLVLWSADPSLVDDRGHVLSSDSFQRIALANPKLAPYGVATLEVLNKLGLKDRLTPRFVEGLNITQAHQFVATGNVPLGFVAMSQVVENGRIKSGSAWVIPSHLHNPIQQDAVLLKKSISNQAAIEFLEFLRSDPALSVIRAFGYLN